jgi:NAD(P)-dependent dehydrogenase (short-subunit alcohol dehydrogenase family)
MKKVALITGASRGIGRGIALALARHGYDIAGVATNPDPANTESGIYEVKAHVEKLGQQLHPIRGDVSSLEDHPRILAETVDTFGHVDVLVNNAGVSLAKRYDILETTAESYDRVMGINLRGPFFLTQTVANHMVAHPRDEASVSPSIIFITSISATTASVNRAEYCISKMGGSMASQLFAVRLAEHGINVFEIQPGVIRSDMTAGVTEKYDALIEGGLLLQKRWGTPEDIGKACAALAEGYFAYATGAAIEVGGGFGVRRL